MLLADDHPIFRNGLSRALSARPELEVVAEVGDGAAALQATVDLAPDVAVLDLHMPERDGLEVLAALRARGLQTPVVLLTGSAEAAGLYAALAAGVSGFVLKTALPGDVCDAIVAAVRGEVRFPVELQAPLAAEIRARTRGDDRPVLTGREDEILRMTAAGQSASEIAAELHLSLPTIRTHLQNLYQKLEVSDRAAAVAKALRLGLID